MRVPVPIAALLSLAVVACAWWLGTRGLDFLTPEAPAAADSQPTAAEPASTPAPPAAEPPAAATADTPSANPAPSPPAHEPLPDFGDLAASPALDAYADVAASGGATALARLAEALEEKGELQHALLAWERVLDHTTPPTEVGAAARQGVARLRPNLPPWNVDPAGRTKLTLRVEAHHSLRETLAPLVTEAATLLADASSGLLDVTPELVTGKSRAVIAVVPPVAVSLRATAAPARETGVLTFTAATTSPEALRPALLRTLFFLTRNRLEAQPDLTPLPDPGPAADPAELLLLGPTRLAWDAFARSFAAP